jgi:hypothetical protein
VLPWRQPDGPAQQCARQHQGHGRQRPADPVPRPPQQVRWQRISGFFPRAGLSHRRGASFFLRGALGILLTPAGFLSCRQNIDLFLLAAFSLALGRLALLLGQHPLPCGKLGLCQRPTTARAA